MSLGDLLGRRERAIPRGPFQVAPLFAKRARGALLWDVDGREYLDFCGGIGVVNVGHNHPDVVAAIQDQAGELIHSCWHVAMYEPYLELAERLGELVPVPGPCKTVFFNSGAEATENAVKISRAATGRPAVVAFERGFHGRTLLAMTLTGKVHPYSAGFGPFAPEVYRLPWEPFYWPGERGDDEVELQCRGAIAHLFAYHVEPEAISCLLMEPVLGEGGFLPVHPVAARCLQRLCREHGIVFACDEVQTGFGRCGAMFASERYALEPDMVVMAKSLGGGLPLSAVTARAALMDAPQVGGIGGTYGGNPVACAAALAVLGVLERERLAERAEVIGQRIASLFERLSRDHDFLVRPRGLGAMRGIDVVDPGSGLPDPVRAAALLAEARARGLLLMTASGNTVRTLMPLVITDEQLARAMKILEEASIAVTAAAVAAAT
ncbi:MAG TPA: aminotransferase class III-fold pyridoxal phosphate-dependent enzyme [Thermoanaerobaculia bacterium]|nr:aminotransferase class III-fold pyridoxal phosphate-dependent enzyme [Thermoanaerobaculia bacterium]